MWFATALLFQVVSVSVAHTLNGEAICQALYTPCKPVVQRPVYLFQEFADRYYKCPAPMAENAVVSNNRCEYRRQKVDVTCDDGYEFSNGETSRTLECSIDREWIGLENCTAKTCPAVLLENTQVGNLPDSSFMTTITVSCNTNFFSSPTVSDYDTVCQANGEWSVISSCKPLCGDFTYSPALGFGYKIIGEHNFRVVAAEEKCEDEGATLAYPITQDLLTLYQGFPLAKNVHVGMFRNPYRLKWYWINDTETGIEADDDFWCSPTGLDTSSHIRRLVVMRPAGCLIPANGKSHKSALCQKECIPNP